MNFTEQHKIRIPSPNNTNIEVITGTETKNVESLSDNELFALQTHLTEWYNEQMSVLNDEINRWQPIYCAVCGEEDLAFRGKPFVTWGMRNKYVLCPGHLKAFDRRGQTQKETLAQFKVEDKELQEIFG